MKRTPFVLLASWLLLATSAVTAQSQPAVPLEVKGGNVQVVKVDKVIIVKEDLTVVNSFPFTINAPPGAGLYFWSAPAGVSGNDMGDHFEVTTAPKGPCTITVKAISANVDKDGKYQGFVTAFGRVSFSIGDIPPPPFIPPVTPPDLPPDIPPTKPPVKPPVVIPPVLSKFEQDVADAWAKETEDGKLEHVRQLAANFRAGIPWAKDASVATSGALFTKMLAAEAQLAKKVGDQPPPLPAGCLTSVKTVIGAELNRSLNRNPLTPFTDDTRKSSAETLERIAIALEKLK